MALRCNRSKSRLINVLLLIAISTISIVRCLSLLKISYSLHSTVVGAFASQNSITSLRFEKFSLATIRHWGNQSPFFTSCKAAGGKS